MALPNQKPRLNDKHEAQEKVVKVEDETDNEQQHE